MERAAALHSTLHRAINDRRQYLMVCAQHKEYEVMKGEANL